jgi:hypothetical protein
MSQLRRSAVAVSLLFLLFVGGAILVYRHTYPYGVRPASLPIMIEALRAYSTDKAGAFPDAGANPLEALRKLYPKYLADPLPLAGLSGDRQLLKQQILEGSAITEAASSWVYWPGLSSDDDPEIAVIWERRSGLRFNGSRAQGHEVGFVGGYMRQVSDGNWEAFVKEQGVRRGKALSARTSVSPHH